MRAWRLIVDESADGAWNMALDRALLEEHAAGDAPPTLRLYRWGGPTVSLGRFQAVADVDADACRRYGVAVCRRPTGGRGVLHDDELTYAVIAGVSDGVPRGTSASYRHLCGALVEAYRTLGVDADLTARARGQRGAGACYLHATQADLSIGAAKLSGSAQVWRGGSCLQHGSFVVTRDVVREAAVFGLDAEQRAALARDARTIAEVTGERPGSGVLIDAATGGFARALGVVLEPGVVSTHELAVATALVEESRVALAQDDV